MSFFRQFEIFDPITGEVPDYPFSLLPSIATRARSLLAERAHAEIISAAHNIDWFIEEYFQSELKSMVEDISQNGGYVLGYLPYEQRNEIDIRLVLEDWPSDADDPPPEFPTEDNTCKIDALKRCIDEYELEDDPDFPNGQKYEYFAVLSLWILADALMWLNRDIKDRQYAIDFTTNIGLDTELAKSIYMNTSIDFSLAGSCALEAMDAVCFAENLRETERLKQSHAKALILTEDEVRKEAKNKEKKRRSVVAQKLNIHRHAKRNEAMELVLCEWEKNPNDFPSAEKAGIHYADWLVDQGYKYEPRTVVGWIRKHAKKSGIRLR